MHGGGGALFFVTYIAAMISYWLIEKKLTTLIISKVKAR